jgi:hypothetical protein
MPSRSVARTFTFTFSGRFHREVINEAVAAMRAHLEKSYRHLIKFRPEPERPFFRQSFS